MADLMDIFPAGCQVKTPAGTGIVVGQVVRNGDEQLVILFDDEPVAGGDSCELFCFPFTDIYWMNRRSADGHQK